MAMARPPSTYDGRTTSGKPILSAASRASSGEVAMPLGACGMPRAHSSCENRSRSSARSIEFGGAGVDALVGDLQSLLEPRCADRVLVGAEHVADLPVAEAGALERAHQVGRDAAQPDQRRLLLELDELLELGQEPGVDVGQP